MAVAVPTIRVAVAGATGYAGAGCVRLLQEHPQVELAGVSSRSHAGVRHAEACPGSACQMLLSEAVDAGACDLVLSAQAPGECARQAGAWLEQGAVVLDVSPDFRLDSSSLYRNWYGAEHPAPDLLRRAVLALPELDPSAIGEAGLLALPGCFSTAAILACGPAAAAGLVLPEVVVDAKTGASGAGRGAAAEFLFSEVAESVRAYQVGGHRHRPEMERALAHLGGEPFSVTFVPHLVPMVRGIVATCYLKPRQGVSLE
ncbi:MAG: N-acetyl-gamma-glutamyl-phosphate reductase, partial [Candidatus Dormibacteria bacterium]